MTIIQARRVATRMGSIGTESAFEVSARARALAAQGRPMIYLQIGEPDFDTPANVRAAAKRALDEGETHYAPFPGIPALREAIAADVTMRKGVEADPSQVFVTVGGKGVMLYAILGLVDPGDEVIVPDPGYPIYESLTRFVGATPVPIPIRMENEFRLDVDELASLITPRTRVLFINSPANPTGGVLTRVDNERIAELAIEHDLWVVSDERLDRAHLSERGCARDRVDDELRVRRDERRRHDRVAETPAGHRECLRESVEDDRAFRHPG
ncbi:MAG: aminotransferase class I/II-fold pyridoxal phosphate-dependent enzyme, partial [Chloroflexi bacterium]|nr:aminotransferase class I/II-fold pyridoxal phosphate-dependent enzyme [Chloroflexota bacterium]